jgi:asparagine synthase (glutamine-hydrolysing)
MCGITGFIDYQKSISEKDLLNASTALRHRGGDGNGHVFEQHANYSIGLANERLAIIDTSTNGKQPFTSSCGNYTITFNGTIYNYQDLRQSLIKYGIIFNTLSDTEVLLECYKKWGFDLFDKIDGVFAFAILDRKQKQLFLARDTMGVKPLYYFKTESSFIFSSEIKSLLQYPTIKKSIDKGSLQEYLRHGYFLGHETLFEGIKNFKRKNAVIIDLNSGNSLEREFSNTDNQLIDIPNDENKILSCIEELITDSILKRNIADVNVGVLLSGGYDSATVTAILQKNHAKKLKTFTLGFKGKKFDEAPHARQIASYLNTNHQEYYIDNKGATEILESLPDIFDEPMGDSGAIPLAFIAKQVSKEKIKVLLGAEGGDELFAGYTNYKKAIWLYERAKRIPNFLKPVLTNVSRSKKNKLEEIFNSASALGSYEALTAFFSKKELSSMLNQDFNEDTLFKEKGDTLKSLLNYDLNNYLPNDLLLKSDRISMHYGIDNRDALLKTDLVNFMQQLDDKWFLKNDQLKYLLKKITHQYIPQKLLDRPKKGFSIPIEDWMGTIYKPYIEEYLSPTQLYKHQLFNIIEVFKLKNRFYTHRKGSDARKLWLLLQFQMWYNKYFD